ncbi:MAG: DUF2079 domain-containing protein [Thermoplasmataceae archaeon]
MIVGYFNLLLYNSFQYTQFDLGVSYRTLYNFHVSYHFYNWPSPPIETPQTFSKFIYVPLSLSLYIYNSPFMLLFDQILLISIGGLAVFGISKAILKDTRISLLIELAYFLYPATYGFMTQGGNFMVFFEPLLLSGYYFYIKGRKFSSLVLFILASITNAFAPLILISILILPYLVRLLKLIKKTLFQKGIIIDISPSLIKKNILELSIFIIPIFIFILSLKLYGFNALYGSTRLGSPSTLTSSSSNSIVHRITENFSEKLNFFGEVFQPFLYLPLLTIYAIPILIYLLIAWYSNQFFYYDILVRQYPFLFAGIVFISLIFSLKKLKLNSKNLKKIVILIIISSLVSFATSSPFNVGNIQSGNIKYEITETPLEINLTKAFNLIPINSSVLIQNDIVQLMNRKYVYFPGYYENQVVQYAIFAPRGVDGLTSATPSFSSKLANQFANNNSYGLYVKIGNMEIYKLGYTGPLVLFSNEKISGISTLHVERKAKFTNLTYSESSIQLSPGFYNYSVEDKVNSSVNLTSRNISVNITMIGTNKYVANYTSKFRFVILTNNSIVIYGLLNVKNFDYYTLNFQVEFSNSNTNINYNFIPYYSINSVRDSNL